ncbi:MAG: adenylate cyclase, partial [bacterium]
LCPNCHGVNSRNYHLESVQSPSHCSACNIDYTVEFDQHVEVRFHPDEKIRTLDEEDRCPLNPAFNSHVWSQINVESKETKEVKIQFEAGRYRIHSLDLDGDLIFDVSDKGKTKTSLSFDQDKFLSINEKEIFLDTLFYFENNTGTKKTFRIEKLNQFQYAATASEVTTLQDFRDLFGSEVLQPNVQLGVSNLCFLFSDLKDSTKLYEAVGDATAFSIIQNHFAIMIKIIREFQGGVVKTIGDAVMAVFSDPVLAFQASQKILEVFEKRNIERPNEEKIILKLGLHRGPCIVINFNECIDYFGSTVNKSARIEAESNGGELIFSEEIMKDVRHLLKLYDQKQHVKPFYKRLKGIQKEQKLYRLVMNEFKL